MKTVHNWEKGDDNSNSHCTSWVSVCPSGLVEVFMTRTQKRGREDPIPKMGSLCKIRVQSITDDGLDIQNPACEEEHDMLGEVDTLTQTPCYPRSLASVLQIPLRDWVFIRMGEGQCDVIEGCLEGMTASEKCELQVKTLKNNTNLESGYTQSDSPALEAEEMEKECRKVQASFKSDELLEKNEILNDAHHFMVELHSFTPGCESWEMNTGKKWAWVKSHKVRGGQRFHNGDVWGAADSYSRALRLLVALKGEKGGEPEGNKDEKVREDGTKGKHLVMPGSKSETDGREDWAGQGAKAGSQGTEEEEAKRLKGSITNNEKPCPEDKSIPSENEYKAIRSELHSNLSLCQLRLGQPAKAQQSSSRATELDPTNAKAWYRLGQACLQVGELAKARNALRRVLKLQPGSPSALKSLREVDMQEKELNNKLGQRLSKMFS